MSDIYDDRAREEIVSRFNAGNGGTSILRAGFFAGVNADHADIMRERLATLLRMAATDGGRVDRERCRDATQAVVAEIGADGPTSLEQCLTRMIAELRAGRAVVEMAKSAYAADAVSEWFDAEGDGLRSALAAYDAEVMR